MGMEHLDAEVAAVLGLGSNVDASEYLYFSMPKEAADESRTLSEVNGAEHSCWRLVLGVGTEDDINALDAERRKPRILHFQEGLQERVPDFWTEEFQVAFSVGEGTVAVVYENVWIRQQSNVVLISGQGRPLSAVESSDG